MGRQLASFGDISYTYNEDGIRTSKTSNGVTTKFYLDGTRIIEQTDGAITLHFFYDSNSEVIGFRYNESDYFYVKNVMGDVVGMADIVGNLVASYTYDAWGKVTSVTGSNTELGNLNPFRYRSYYYDVETELYYLQSRYYDPEVCRFINSDDVGFIGVTIAEISYNPFAYCENNPVNNLDVFGNISLNSIKTFFSDLIEEAKGKIISYLNSLVVAENNRIKISNSIISSVIDAAISFYLVGKVYKVAEKVIGHFSQKIAQKDPTRIYKILKFFLDVLANKYVLKHFSKKIVSALGLKFKAVSTLVKDFVNYFITNEFKIIEKICVYASAFSSIGGAIAFLLDCIDNHKIADGYFSLVIYKRSIKGMTK